MTGSVSAPAGSPAQFLGHLKTLVRGPAEMVQLRAHELDDGPYAALARDNGSILD